MCGIVGILNLDGDPVREQTLTTMRDAMWHRGPDDAGIWVNGGVGLAQRRLSILDLSPLGHQPMHSADGQACIVFNGEIFNFVELRAALIARGHTFQSESDTEVLLRLWQQDGPDCLRQLVGMFGFAVWDQSERRLFAARDRAGIKPFHYAQVGRTLIFASEIKAILAHPGVVAALDAKGLADHVFAGYALEDRTLFSGVRSLPPGHALEVIDGHVTVREYWRVDYRYDHARSFEATVDELSVLLDDAVRLHCRSDAPIGAHLSGGLDSSTIAAIASNTRPGLPTFSIRFDAGATYDESQYARMVAERIGSSHHEELPSPTSLEELIPFLIYHVETPVTRTAVAYFSAARLARRHVTVALTGHGGDEVFGGYPAQFRIGLGAAGEASSASVAARPMSAWERIAFLVRSEGLTGVFAKGLGRSTGAKGPETPADRWIAEHCGLPEPLGHPAFTAAFKQQLGGYSPRAGFLTAFEGVAGAELFDRCLHHDLRSYLPSLLHVEDRTSMATSLESRVPFLDHRLIEFAATVPAHTKVPAERSKQLIRAAMRGRLPDEIIDRKDKGAFPVPITQWMDGPFGDYARRILLSARSLDRGIHRPEWIKACVAHRRGVFPLLTFELWCRLFLDRDDELLRGAQDFSSRLRKELHLL